MSETQPQAGELPTPRVEAGDRRERVLWPVGDPDAEGYQRYVALTVEHHGSGRDARGYRAYLGHAEIRHDPPFVSEKIAVLAGGRRAPLATQDAARFSQRRFAEFAAQARAEAEARFAAGDPEVAVLFSSDGDLTCG